MMSQILLSVLALPLAACSVSVDAGDEAPGVPAQGSGGTRTYAVTDFTRVELRGADSVDVRVGPGFSVRADGDPEVLDRLKITKEGDAIRIGRIRSEGWSWGGKNARISITMPTSRRASAAGSGDVTVDRVQGQRFKGETAGSGSLRIDQLAVREAELSVAGSGDVKAAGRADALRISIAGSGDVDAGGLTAQSANVSVAGSGSVRAEVQGTAKVNVMGSGDVELGGGAKCEINKMGSGEVRCG
jgi:hypothetical protein